MDRGAPTELTNILVVDDNPGDVRLLREALLEVTQHRVQLCSAANGMEAASLLAGVGPNFPDGRDPQLLLLDLNMPIMPGIEFLTAFRSQAAWNDVPVFVLSATQRSAEIEEALGCGADRFIHKPSRYDDYLRISEAMVIELAGSGAWDTPTVLSMTARDLAPARLRQVQRVVAHNRAQTEEAARILASSRRCIQASRRRCTEAIRRNR